DPGSLTLTLHDTVNGSGSVDFSYSVADQALDFLAANETLTVIYNVTVTDINGLSSTKPVTITVTGTNDAPLVAADASGPHTIPELLGKTGDATDIDSASGTLLFTDVDLTDTHTPGKTLVSAVWNK